MYLWKFQLPAHKSETSPGSSMKHNTNQRVHSAMCIVHARKYVDITLHDSRRSLSTLTPCMSSCAWYNISFNISHPPVHRCFIFSHRQFYEMHTIFYQRNCYILNLQDYFSVKMSFCTGLNLICTSWTDFFWLTLCSTSGTNFPVKSSSVLFSNRECYWVHNLPSSL